MIKIKCVKSNINLKNIKILASCDMLLDVDYFLEWANYLLGYIEINQLYKKKCSFDIKMLHEILIFQIKAYKISNDFRYLNVVLKFEQYVQKQFLSQICVKFAHKEIDKISHNLKGYC
jgi:hypothetical protein